MPRVSLPNGTTPLTMSLRIAHTPCAIFAPSPPRELLEPWYPATYGSAFISVFDDFIGFAALRMWRLTEVG